MAEGKDVEGAVREARRLLSGMGYRCETTAEDFLLWFQADTPYDQGGEFDYVIKSPLLVAHELVEIACVKAMGLQLTKDVIVENMQKVDDAHLKAAQVEIGLAISLRDSGHIRERIRHMGMWIDDPSVSEENKEKYRELRERASKALMELSVS